MEEKSKLCTTESKKVIFFDIDGTLHCPTVGIPLSAKEGIRKLKENGHLVFICTGRTKAMLFNELEDMGFDGIIAGAGTYVEYEKEVLYRYDLDEETARSIATDFRTRDIIPVPEGHDIFYLEDERNWSPEYKYVYEKYYSNVGGRIEKMPADDKGIKCAKMSGVMHKASDIEKAKAAYEEEYLVVLHGNVIIELIPKGFSKAEGIKRMLDKLGIRRENTYAFGDSMNDYEMLEYVQYGVAMGNSDERLLSVAAYVADTVENDGIYKALEHYGLI
jgi:Cof subfamily protein (haloacid dehalogenase superfamily)